MSWKDEAAGETAKRLKYYLGLVHSWFPRVWKQTAEFIALKACGDPEFQWPGWCFMPLAGAFAIATQGRDLVDSPEEVRANITQVVSDIGALTAWRATQGIYRFHPEVFESVWETELTDKLPVELFYRMPEWCPYIETPGKFLNPKQRLFGFFAFLEFDKNTEEHELRLMLDLGSDKMTLLPVILHISGRKTIADMIQGYVDTVMQHAPADIGFTREEIREWLTASATAIVNSVKPCLSLLLYLCSTASDIRESGGSLRLPRRPAPKKVKGGMKLFPPDKPTIWDTGWRLGAMIDRSRAQYEKGPSEGGTHTSPVPHIRKPHWHSFWKGPKKEPEKRNLVCYWLPPIPVRVRDIEQLVPTIYPVR